MLAHGDHRVRENENLITFSLLRRYKVDITPHRDLQKYIDKGKLVRYQLNPTKNWGPGSKAKVVSHSRAAADAAQYAETSAKAADEDEPMGDLTGTRTDEAGELEELGLNPDLAEYPENTDGVEIDAAEVETSDVGNKRKRDSESGSKEGVKRTRVEEPSEEDLMNG